MKWEWREWLEQRHRIREQCCWPDTSEKIHLPSSYPLQTTHTYTSALQFEMHWFIIILVLVVRPASGHVISDIFNDNYHAFSLNGNLSIASIISATQSCMGDIEDMNCLFCYKSISQCRCEITNGRDAHQGRLHRDIWYASQELYPIEKTPCRYN